MLIIGGSELFHAASKWSLDIASKIVDMVFYSSVPQNNELIKEAKGQFWNGIVVDRTEIENYIDEADSILIGPGMTRSPETENTVNSLLSKYSDKKWIIDAGALQMMNPKLLNSNCIITPHQGELTQLLNNLGASSIDSLIALGCTILLKGPIDHIYQHQQIIEVEGGNAGMTKGGTGDVLAGLVAALTCTQDALASTVTASYVNKMAAEKLYAEVGPYFNASDLVTIIPEVLWESIKVASN